MRSVGRAIKLKLPVPCIETNGFFPYESFRDVISLIGSDANGPVLSPEKMDAVLHSNTMLPTGQWILKFPDYQEFQRTAFHLSQRIKEVSRIEYRKITDESKLFEFQTASKYGIDSKTVLAYDISPTVDSEELQYALEGFKLDPKGIRKIAADKSSISFLIHFASRSEAERALFELNGSSFAGSSMHLHIYS